MRYRCSVFVWVLAVMPGYAQRTPDPLPEEAVARLGHARLVTQTNPSTLHVSHDGKFLVCGRDWFDVESGTRVKCPYPGMDNFYVETLLEDGCAVFSEFQKYHIHERGNPQAKISVEIVGGFARFSQSGNLVVAKFVDGEGENRRYILRIAKIPHPGNEPVWKEIYRSPDDLYRFAPNRHGTHVVWKVDRNDSLGIYAIATDKTTTIDVKTESGFPFQYPAISPDGSIAAAQIHRKMSFFDTNSGKLLHAREVDVTNSQECSFTPDGKAIFIPGYWGLQQYVPLDPAKKIREIALRGHGNYGSRVFSDSKRVAIVDHYGVIRIHEFQTGKQLDHHAPYPAWKGIQLVGRHTAACWSEWGEVVTWDTRTGKSISEFKLAEENAEFQGLMFSPDGKSIAAWAESQYAGVFEASSGKKRFVITSAGYYPTPACFSSDSSMVGVIGARKEMEPSGLEWFDAVSGKSIRHVAVPFHHAVVSTDSRTILNATPNGTELIEVATQKPRWSVGDQLGRAKVNGGKVQIAQFDRTGNRVVVVRSSQVQLLDALTGRSITHFWFEQEPENPIPSAVSADCRWLAIVESESKKRPQLFVFDLEGDRPDTPVLTRFLPGKYVRGVALDETGAKLVTAHVDGTCLVWDLEKWVTPHLRPKVGKSQSDPWELLTDLDPAEAQKAMIGFLKDPRSTVRLVEAKVQAVPEISAAEWAKWLRDLGDDDFKTREAASRKLATVVDQGESELRKALAITTDAETRLRIEKLLSQRSDLASDPHRLRQIRVVELLERIQTPEAMQLLERYAKGAKNATLTREAMQEALERRKK